MDANDSLLRRMGLVYDSSKLKLSLRNFDTSMGLGRRSASRTRVAIGYWQLAGHCLGLHLRPILLTYYVTGNRHGNGNSK